MLEVALDATASRIEDDRSGVTSGGCVEPGRLYMASIVGRRAAPKGVERKSVGKSKEV